MNNMDNPEIRSLLEKLLANSLDAEGLKRLQKLARNSGNDHLFDEFIEEVMMQKRFEQVHRPDKEKLLREILQDTDRLEAFPEAEVFYFKQPVYQKNWFKYAASVLLLIVGGIYFWNTRQRDVNRYSEANDALPSVRNDVAAPSSAKATLTLANGQTIYLDSMGNGTLANEMSAEVVKTADGAIIYNALSVAGVEEFNTLEVPRGSKVVTIALSDKSRVWLNAGSSLKYPVVFKGKERIVEITGEAYFEVAKNASAPFIVKKKESDTRVHVLGTHFNVNAYDDEASINITLIEGAVNVQKGAQKILMMPGQQAQVTQTIHIENKINIEEVMAWKNGKFRFESLDIRSIMRQLARTYDVDIEYKGEPIKETFGGSITREVNLSQVLKMMELTGMVKLDIEGRKIVVEPAQK